MTRAKLQQAVVGKTEQRSSQSGEHRQLVVGALDGGERHAHRFDLFSVMEPAPTHEHVRNIESLKRFDVRLCDRSLLRDETAEQKTDIGRSYGSWNRVAA